MIVYTRDRIEGGDQPNGGVTKNRNVAHFRLVMRRKFHSVAHFSAQKWAFFTFCGAEGAARKSLSLKGPKNALKPDFRGFVQWPTFGFSEIVQRPNPRSPPPPQFDP